MTHIKVLIVDDNTQLRRTLRATIEEVQTWEIKDQGFEDLPESLCQFRPDMIILDLINGAPQDGQDTGNASFGEIRETWFCPVIVYSAFPDKQTFDHPYVARVKKGKDSEKRVLECLEKFIPEARLIQSVHQDFDLRIREALRDSVRALRDQAGGTDGSIGSAVRRAVRRLVAARMDAGTSQDGNLQAWERFVIPPIGDHLLTADLLKRLGGEWMNPEDFRLVLTPSCDLVIRKDLNERQQVLVSRCEPIRKLGKIDLVPGRELTKKQKERLRSILTEGMTDTFLPIPGFKGHVPVMVANLKQLELIEIQKIGTTSQDQVNGTGNFEFERVASTDSPFRETVAWAYLRVTGRPGLPPFDVAGWLCDISDYLKLSEYQ